MQNEKSSLENEIGQMMLVQTVLTAVPDLVKMFPKIDSLIEMLDKGIDDYLSSGKMLVVTKRNNMTLALVLDTNKEFTLSNKMVLDGDQGSVLNQYEKAEWKNKLVNSVIYQTLKERYEKLSDEEKGINSNNPILSILK